MRGSPILPSLRFGQDRADLIGGQFTCFKTGQIYLLLTLSWSAHRMNCRVIAQPLQGSSPFRCSATPARTRQEPEIRYSRYRSSRPPR